MSGRVNLLDVGTVSNDKAFRATEIASNIQYLGWADPNTATSASTWKICKLTYNAEDTTIIKIEWPTSANAREYVWEWDERANYESDPTYT